MSHVCQECLGWSSFFTMSFTFFCATYFSLCSLNIVSSDGLCGILDYMSRGLWGGCATYKDNVKTQHSKLRDIKLTLLHFAVDIGTIIFIHIAWSVFIILLVSTCFCGYNFNAVYWNSTLDGSRSYSGKPLWWKGVVSVTWRFIVEIAFSGDNIPIISWLCLIYCLYNYHLMHHRKLGYLIENNFQFLLLKFHLSRISDYSLIVGP